MADNADITGWLDAARGGDRKALDHVLASLQDGEEGRGPARTAAGGRG